MEMVGIPGDEYSEGVTHTPDWSEVIKVQVVPSLDQRRTAHGNRMIADIVVETLACGGKHQASFGEWKRARYRYCDGYASGHERDHPQYAWPQYARGPMVERMRTSRRRDALSLVKRRLCQAEGLLR